MLGALLRFLKPRFLAEAGTYQGHFAILAAACLDRQQCGGHVYTFDIEDFGVEAFAEKQGLTPCLTFAKADFRDVLSLFPHLAGLCDVVFIDSGPVPGGTTNANLRWDHWQFGKQLLHPGGLLLCDDLLGEWSHVDEIKAECGLFLSGGRGLGIWQKPYG